MLIQKSPTFPQKSLIFHQKSPEQLRALEFRRAGEDGKEGPERERDQEESGRTNGEAKRVRE